jgi:hypothetical protein
MVNATRLKHYFDPSDRPTNPPPGYENLTESLNAEEMPQIDSEVPPTAQTKTPNEKMSEKDKQTDKNKKSKAKHSNKETNKTIPRSDTVNKPQEQQVQGQSTSSDETNNQPDPTPSTSTETSPSDNQTPTSKSKLFSVDEIDKIISSQRSKNILYYRIKWKDPQKSSTWEYASTIPEVFIRDYHVNRTMSGKKRKKPLQHTHQFFKTLPGINLLSYDRKHKTVRDSYVIGYTETYDLSNQRLIYNEIGKDLSHSGIPFKISERKRILQPYLNILYDQLKHVDFANWHSNVGILNNGQEIEGKMIRGVITYDFSHPLATTYFKVYHTDSKQPVWLPFSQAPVKLVRQLLFRISSKIKCTGQLFKSTKGPIWKQP